MRISDWSSDVCSSDLRQVGRQDFLKRLEIGGDDLEDEVDFTVEHVTFADFGNVRHVLFEFGEIALGLALEADHREHGDRIAQRGRIEFGVIPLDRAGFLQRADAAQARSEEHTSELQSLMRISYAVFCLKKKKNQTSQHNSDHESDEH